MNKSLHSSKYHKWETPDRIFNELDKEFNFTLDPCCLKETAKCDKYYTPKENGLEQDWYGETVFVNPPYGREIKDWVKKSFNESRSNATTVVMLIPARTDTKYFHDYIWDENINRPKIGNEVRFIKGRIKFLKEGKEMDSAPFPSMIVVFK